MKFVSLYEKLERLWRNARLNLGSQYDSMLEFLVTYSPRSNVERAFNYIIDNSNLKEVSDPQMLWKNYLTFKIRLSETYNNFPVKETKQNLPAVLVNIILCENQLCLLERYPTKISIEDPRYTSEKLSEVEHKIREYVAALECNSGNVIQEPKAKISLYSTYLRNWEWLKPNNPYFIKGKFLALCGIIITSQRHSISLPNQYVEDILDDLKTLKSHAKANGMGIPINSLCRLYHSLEAVKSPHTNKARRLYRAASRYNTKF
jgi:hypothetical protein